MIIYKNSDTIPDESQEFFTNSLPAKPYYTDNPEKGLKIAKKETALKHKYIQFNDAAFHRFLVFDIDKSGAALAWEDADLTAPNTVVINPKNTHAHLFYYLKDPVCKTDKARLKPINYLKAIYQAYAVKLQADTAYAGLIAKNPLNPAWRTWYIHNNLYSLSELADYVKLQKIITKKALSEDFIGRNDGLFGTIRVWAYKARYNYKNYNDFKDAVFSYINSLNQLFAMPLRVSEIKSITKSVANFVWKNFTEESRPNFIQKTHTSELQAKRGIKSGIARYVKNEDKRVSARLLRAQGGSYREIAKELNISSHMTIINWLKN